MTPMYDYNRISVAQPKVQDITPTRPEWKKGLASFADEMQALGGGAVALAGQATGMEGVRDWGLDVYERNMEESTAGWQAPDVARIEDIKPFETGGMDRLGDWAAYHGTKGLANVASLALSGGIGGAIAKGATKRAVKEIAKSQVGKNLAGRTVTAGVKKGAVDDVRRNVTRGAAAGGFVGAFGMEGGGAFGQQVGGGVAPEDALLPSLGVGAVNAALELVAPYQIAKKLGLVGKAREGIAAVIPKDRTLAKKAIELAGKVVKGGASASATEGLTEGIQELVQLAGDRWAKDEELLAALSPEERSQIMNASAAGALVGGGVGGATGPFVQEPTRAPEVQPTETMADIDEATKAAAAQAGQEAGTPEARPEGATPEIPSTRDEWGALFAARLTPAQQEDYVALNAKVAAEPLTPGQQDRYENYKKILERPEQEAQTGETKQESRPLSWVDFLAGKGVNINDVDSRAPEHKALKAEYDALVTQPTQKTEQPVQPTPQKPTTPEVSQEVAGTPSLVQELGAEEIQAVPVSPEVGANQAIPAPFPEASAQAFDVEEIEAVPTADMQLQTELAQVAHDVQLGILDKNEAEKVAVQKSKAWQQRLEAQARETRKKQRAIEREQIGVLGEKAFELPSTGTRDEQLRLNRIAKENSNVVADIYKKAVAQGVSIDDPSVSSAMQKLTQTDDVSSRWWNGLSDNSKKVMGQKVGYTKADLGERSWTDLPPAVRNRLVQKLTGERQNLNLLRSEAPSGAAQKAVPRTVQEVEVALSDELGQGWITRAKKAGMLNILDEAGRNGRQADYDQETGEITIYAKSLGEGSTAAVALHEGSHATMDELLGGRLGEVAQEVFNRGAQEARAGQETNAATAARKAEQVHYRWKAMQLQRQNPEGTFLKDYDALAETGKSGAAKSLVNNAWGKLDQEVRTLLDKRANEILNEEAVAYYVEGSAGTADGLLRRIVNRIKAEWLASAPGQTFAKMRLSPKIDDGTAVALARKATKYAVDLREEMDRRGAPSAAQQDSVLESQVWHAGPYEWLPEPGYPYGRPRLDKVGTGEGGQLFGWGWYSAENEKVSGPEGEYAKAFALQAPRSFEFQGELTEQEKLILSTLDAGSLADASRGEGMLSDMVPELEESLEYNKDPNLERALRIIKANPGLRVARSEPRASIFRLEIPDEHIDRMIQWEKPLGEQTEEVKQAIAFMTKEGNKYRFYKEMSSWLNEQPSDLVGAGTLKAVLRANRNDDQGTFNTLLRSLRTAFAKENIDKELVNSFYKKALQSPYAIILPENATGQDLYNRLDSILPNVPGEHHKKKVSNYLQSLGIVGNKFLDFGSRGEPKTILVDKQGIEVPVESLGPYAHSIIDALEKHDGNVNKVRLQFQEQLDVAGQEVRDATSDWESETAEYKMESANSILDTLREFKRQGYEVKTQGPTYNYVVWDQDVLNDVAHLNQETGIRKFTERHAAELDEIAKKADAPASSLERMSGVLEDSTLASMRDFADNWVSSPLSAHYDEVTSPRLLNKLKHYYVEKFNDLWQMSKEAATKFNLATSKKASAQKDFEKEFIHPWRDLMVKLSEDMSKGGKKYSVEDLNDAWASWSVVNDNLNVLLARRNSNESLDQLNKEIFAFEKILSAGDPTRVRLKELRLKWEKGRKNLLAGKTWEGTDPVSDDGVTPRIITSAEAQHKMMDKLEELFDAPVEGTKVWQASEKLQELRMEWEMMKYQGSGLATPDTASQVPEVRAELENIIELHGDRAPKNAYELHDAVKGNASFLAAVPKAKEIAKRGRDALVKGELITREEADVMEDMYKHWMPLQREDYDYDESVKKLFGRGQSSGKLKTRAGTSKVNPPVHTMQNLMASFDASITAMEGNLARKYLADEIQANPDHWENWFEVTQDKDAQRSMGKYGFIQTRKAGGEVVDIPFYRNGERWLIKPNTANNRAVMLSNAIQNLDSQELGPVFKMMNKVNSWIRWTNISASPAFLLMNAPRDYFTAMLNLKGTELADFTKDVRKEVGPSLKALNNHFRKGIDDPEIREWEEAGGRISFVESLRPNDEAWGSVEAQIRHRQGNFNFGPGMEANFGPGAGVAVSKGRDFLERLETINIMTENVMRYSTWKVAKQQFLAQGMTEQQAKDKAALLSKDVTTNFDRKGLRAQTLGTYWLFYNATVQGNAQVIRNMFEGANKQKLWGALAGVAAFAFINDQLGAELSDDEDGDGRSDWDSTPEWKKEKFGRIAGSNVLWPGEESTFATVPLPWVFNTVWRFGEMVSESMRGVKDSTEIPADMVGLMLNTFNPLGGSDTTPMQMAAPTAVDPIVQILENTSAFGRPLGPTQYPGQELTPDSELSWLNTPPRYKWLARQINDITGGTTAEKGLVDWRPSTYKVLADTLMGGGGRFLEQLAGSGFTAATGKAPEVKEVPFIKPFLFAPGDPIEAEKYHERMAKVEQAKYAEKTFMKGPQRDLMELQRVRADYAGELRMVGMANDVERQLKDLRKQLRMAQARGQDSRVDFLKGKMEKAQERFNKTWASRVGN